MMNSPRLMKKDLYELNQDEELLLAFRNDPVFAAKELLNLELAWYQKEVLENMWHKRFVLLLMSRGASKTSLTAIYLVLKAMLYPYTQIGCMSSTYRQACLVFNELSTFLYPNSEFLRSCCPKGVSISTSRALLSFPANGSKIEALPLGDANKGGKIRGARYNIVFVDEFAEVPREVINLVIRPFMAVKRKGMKNQMISASTARYKWNHFWPYYLYYRAKSGNVPKDQLPQGFKIDAENYYLAEYDFRDMLLDPDAPFEPDMPTINESFAQMTEDEFAMEYLNVFPDETTGFFPSELVMSSENGCVSWQDEHQIFKTDRDAKKKDSNRNMFYVFGIDSARSESKDAANFCLQVMRVIDDEVRHLCKTITSHGSTYQEMIEIIRRAHVDFGTNKVMGIAIDAGGGGTTLRDYLAEPWKDRRDGKIYDPLIDMNSDVHEHIKSQFRTIHMYNQTDVFNNSMFHMIKADMEKRRFLLPLSLKKDSDKVLEKIGREIGFTKGELIQIQISETRAGFKFTVPKGQQKDRAVALALANYDINMILSEEEENIPELGIGGWV